MPECEAAKPSLARVGAADPDHLTACVRHDEIAAELARDLMIGTRAAHPEVAVHATSAPLVRIDGLSKTFGEQGKDRTVHALKEVTLEIGEGESVGLVGESGSGKTTLGRCLIGLETPSQGKIVIDGTDVLDPRAHGKNEVRARRREVQMVFQDPYSTLNPVRTIGSTLTEAIAASGSDRASTPTVAELLDRVGLNQGCAKRKPAALSGGERQRVAVARALAGNPRLIVCDEAVSALDVSVQAQIVNLLLSVHRETGVSLLFITHDLAVVRQVTDRLYVLRKGVVVENGLTDRVLDDPQDAYTRALLDAVPGSEASVIGAPAPPGATAEVVSNINGSAQGPIE